MTRGTVPTPPRTLFASFVSRAVCASISLLRIDFEIDPGKYPIPFPPPFIQYLHQCAEKNIHVALLLHPRLPIFRPEKQSGSRFTSLSTESIESLESNILSGRERNSFPVLLSIFLCIAFVDIDREKKEKEIFSKN